MKIIRVIALLTIICLIIGCLVITFVNIGACSRLENGYKTRYSFLEMKCEMNVNGQWFDITTEMKK